MSDAKVDTRRLVGRLLLVTVLMFAFGFALVPLYDVMCRALGINGKTAGSAYSGEQQVDVGREVKVQFMTSNNIDMVWEFRSAGDQLVVHPGAVKALKEAGQWSDAQDAHNNKLIKRQEVLGAAWTEYGKSNPPSDDKAFLDGWMKARAAALAKADMPNGFED